MKKINMKSSKLFILFNFLLFTNIIGYSQTRSKAIDLDSDAASVQTVTGPEEETLSGSAFTIEMWVKLLTNSYSNVNFFTLTAGSNQFSVSLIKKNEFRLSTVGAAGNKYWLRSNLDQPKEFLNEWRHVAVTCNGYSTLEIYVDGERVDNVTLTDVTGGRLFPDFGNSPNIIRMGGESVEDYSGNCYMSEVRVFKTKLTSAEIAQYYDEEINISHPEWDDLLRYYHGTDDYVDADDDVYVVDEANGVDGEIDPAVRCADYYPPVKPGAFNNSYFNTGYSANTCQTSDIDVSWDDDLRTASKEYSTDVLAGYEIRRGSESTAVYEGIVSHYTDSDVSPGDAYTYSLRTYFDIDGTKFYSDDVLTSNVGSVTDHFEAPSSPSASTDDCDRNVELSWVWSSDAPPSWTIERAENTAFTLESTIITSSLDGGEVKATDTNTPIETDLFYRIKGSGTDANGCVSTGDWSATTTGFSSTPPLEPIGVTAENDLVNNQVIITWENQTDNNADSWKIKRKEAGEGDGETSYFDVDLTSTNYEDDNLQICQSYLYSVAAINECATDGVFSNTEVTGNISQDLSGLITGLECSKGYYPSSVRLQWEIDGGLSQVDRFNIYRALATDEEEDYDLINVTSNNLFFEDETALGGILYNYKIVGEASCDTSIILSNQEVDLGFVIPFGVANGHVEYAGGNPVQDVSVSFQQQNGDQSKSLTFDGDGDYAVATQATDLSNKSFTIEFWQKQKNEYLDTTKNSYSIGVTNGENAANKKLFIGSRSNGNFAFAFNWNALNYTDHTFDGQWHHWACVYDNDVESGHNRFIYKDGVLVVSNTSSSAYLGENQMLTIGAGNGDYFEGNMDEIRVWETARTATEIAENYNRMINAESDGLMAYWRCNEGIGHAIYDCSKVGTKFNKVDAEFIGHTSFSTETPTADQLGIKGFTDVSGDYSVDYIPYIGGGEIFKVIPTFGQHEFSPNSRSIYVGDGAQTHNGLDFTDISSFTVTGKVNYYNSNYPVEGVAVLIDGANAIGIDNQPVRTDEDGNYEITVPIGFHYLSVEKDGHIFSEGIFPKLNEYGDIELYEFVEDFSVDFTDSTKVKVAGRVVGGNREGDKEIGFGKSINNIGVAEIEFEILREGYDLELDSAVDNVISVQTNDTTGEYELYMIPEQWKVLEVGNSAYSLDPEAIPELDLRYSLSEVEVYDTTEVITVDNSDTTIAYEVASFNYHHLLKYIIQVAPEIQVLDGSDNGFVGDSIIYFTNQETGELDTLILGASSPFTYPVFQMAKTYDVNVYVWQKYSNPNHPEGAIEDLVPVKGAEITVNDNLMINPVPSTGETDENGLFAYSFRAGTPNLSQNGAESYTKTFEVNADIDGIGYTWNEGEIYRAYVLGGLPLEGTDFVTYGPEMVDIVLRDPPGSNSYAYIEKGSTFSKAEKWQMETNSNTGLDKIAHAGMYIGAGGGLAGPIIETEYQLDSEQGLEIIRDMDSDGNYKETYTFTERIETSSDANDVGSMADLYIGTSKNAFITKTKNLRLLDRAYCLQYGIEHNDTAGTSEVVMGVLDGFAIDEGNTETVFMYSHAHIINELLPELLVLRDNLLASSKYETHLPYGHPYYGLSNDHNSLIQFKLDTILANPSVDTTHISYTFLDEGGEEQDSVDFINEQITQWINTIQTNEAEKVEATLLQNISVDGSGGTYLNEVSEEYSSEKNWNVAREYKLNMDAAFGVRQNSTGYTMKNTWSLATSVGTGEEESTSHSVKFGYVIDERDQGDYYSIDVKINDGVAVLDRSKFLDSKTDKIESIEDLTAQEIYTSASGVVALTKTGLTQLAIKYTSKSNSFIATAGFVVDAAIFIGETVFIGLSAFEAYEKGDENSTYDISGFSISSPVFSVRGGQTRCPYEGEERTNFYFDEDGESVNLNTATLLRERPVIDVEPSIRSNIPEEAEAVYTLMLQNESESNTDIWYEISIDESTNPDGAVLLIDGLTAERSYLVPAWETLTKTLTLAKGRDDVMDYENIGIVLHSMCQDDPTSNVGIISDTVFVSAYFTPECASIDIEGGQDNWIINYDDDDNVAISLSDYDINHTNLESISFQYKSLSGTPSTVMTFFKDTLSDAYVNYTAEKDIIQSGESAFIWDIKALTDRAYMMRAKSTCTDGSTTESDYYTGLIDRTTPIPFGTPQPADGIFNPEDEISIQFNEEIEAGLVKDFNIDIQAVLNGSDISHGTSVNFDGVNDYAFIPGVSLNDKSFTIEFWMRREAEAGIVLSKGLGDDLIQVEFDASGNLIYTLGQTILSEDPTPYYTAAPETGWHHWAFVYDAESKIASANMDAQNVIQQIDLDFNSANSEGIWLGTNASQTGTSLNGKIHELRIWENARSKEESISEASVTLSGLEVGLYGYWKMDDADGTLLEDLSGNRNMMLNASWSIESKADSRSFSFDGSSQYLTLSAQNAIISEETDMTVELWFKGSMPSTTQTLFSNGLGDGIEVYTDPELAMCLSVEPTGTIVLNSNGYAFNAVTTNFFDANWHHLAIVVDRSSNTKAYVDGALQQQTNSSNIAGFAGSNMYLGARATLVNSITVDTDQHFTGEIDELRFWNSDRSAELINLNKNAKLNGTETGLVAYYPFEHYEENLGVYTIEPTLTDQLDNPDLNAVGDAVASAGDSYSSEVPSIKDARPLQSVDFEYVVNGDQIIITPNIDAYKIENVVLEISVKDIQDLNGNKMLSPVSWTAYVDQNQVTWKESSVSLQAQYSEELEFEVVIENHSGTARSYELENLPAWLITNDATGSIDPNSEKTVRFRINSALNIGTYEQGINLSTSLGFDEKLNVQIRIIEEEPDWTVDGSQYQYSMNVFGRLIIEDVLSTDELDMVAAFVDGECRGVIHLDYVSSLDEALVFLNIYSNQASGDSVVLKAWDASTGTIHEEVTPWISFVANDILGTAKEPIDINASDIVSASIELIEGWNWLSFNLMSDDLETVNSTLHDIGWQDDEIKGQDYFDMYDDLTEWNGSITSNGGLLPEEMYKLRISQDATLKVVGRPVDPDTVQIAIDKGWNYLGFIPQVSMSLEEALAAYQPSEGDVLKGPNTFAMFSGSLGWVGSLNAMEPLKGYMLYADLASTLTYPENSVLQSAKSAQLEIDLPEQWTINKGEFQNNMTLVAEVVPYQGWEIDEDHILLAFVNAECRGFATLIQEKYFITIPGASAFEEVSFLLYNVVTGRTLTVNERIRFASNAIEGSLKQPYELSLGKESSVTPMESMDSEVYPNPFKDDLHIAINSQVGEIIKIEILDTKGIIVNEVILEGKGGIMSYDWSNAKHLSPGVYVVSISTSSFVSQKIVIKH